MLNFSLHRFKLCFEVLQTLFLHCHIFPHTRIDLAHSELFSHLCEINLRGELERECHVSLLKADLFFGILDLHDGCCKRADLVFREVKVFHLGRAFNVDARLLQYLAFGFEHAPLASIVFAVMVAQGIGMRGREGLDLSKGNCRDDEDTKENDDGKGAHGGLSIAQVPE